jgi:hypothetical protein
MAPLAAIITAIDDDIEGIVSLTVFEVNGLRFDTYVPHCDAGTAAGYWSWPPRS